MTTTAKASVCIRQILAEHEVITLTARDWTAFAKALDNTDKPRPKLSAAMKRHRAFTIWSMPPSDSNSLPR